MVLLKSILLRVRVVLSETFYLQCNGNSIVALPHPAINNAKKIIKIEYSNAWFY
jgi:hypothetical protein